MPEKQNFLVHLEIRNHKCNVLNFTSIRWILKYHVTEQSQTKKCREMKGTVDNISLWKSRRVIDQKIEEEIWKVGMMDSLH